MVLVTRGHQKLPAGRTASCQKLNFRLTHYPIIGRMCERPALNKARQFSARMFVAIACALGATCFLAPRVLSTTDFGREGLAWVCLLISMPILGLAFGVMVGIVHGRMIGAAIAGLVVGTLITLLFIAPI